MGADGEVLFGGDALRWQGQAAAVAGGVAFVAWPNWVIAKLNGLGCLEGSPVIAQSSVWCITHIISAWFLCQQLCQSDAQPDVELNIRILVSSQYTARLQIHSVQLLAEHQHKPYVSKVTSHSLDAVTVGMCTFSSVRSSTPGSATRGFMLGLVRSTAGELSCDAEAWLDP